MSAIVVIRRRGLARCLTSVSALTAFAVLLLLLTGAAGWLGHAWLAGNDAPRAFEGFQQVRVKTIQTQLDQIREPYIVVMGDSHAERLFLPSLCGLPVVNAGMSGATLSDLLDLARKITPPLKAEAVLLSVGTNDIWVKRNPEAGEAANGFRDRLDLLTQRLSASWSDRRALIAIPPVSRKEAVQFPRAAAARYSAMLAQSCEPERCIYTDLFAEAGSTPGPRSGFSDGVHLRDYARFVRDREDELCRGLGLTRQK